MTQARLHEALIPVAEFMESYSNPKTFPACPGTAVFLTRTEQDTPPVMIWHVRA